MPVAEYPITREEVLANIGNPYRIFCLPSSMETLERAIQVTENKLAILQSGLGPSATEETDPFDSSGYHSLKAECFMVDSSLRRLIQFSNLPPEPFQETADGVHLLFGSTAEVQFPGEVGGPELAQIWLVGPIEVNLYNSTKVSIASYRSPLGRALLQQKPKAGELVQYEVNGKRGEMLIASIGTNTPSLREQHTAYIQPSLLLPSRRTAVALP